MANLRTVASAVWHTPSEFPQFIGGSATLISGIWFLCRHSLLLKTTNVFDSMLEAMPEPAWNFCFLFGGIVSLATLIVQHTPSRIVSEALLALLYTYMGILIWQTNPRAWIPVLIFFMAVLSEFSLVRQIATYFEELYIRRGLVNSDNSPG